MLKYTGSWGFKHYLLVTSHWLSCSDDSSSDAGSILTIFSSASYDFLRSFSLFLSMWYQSNLKFNYGTLPVSKLNAVRPVTLAHNSVTDKYFTAI